MYINMILIQEIKKIIAIINNTMHYVWSDSPEWTIS